MSWVRGQGCWGRAGRALTVVHAPRPTQAVAPSRLCRVGKLSVAVVPPGFIPTMSMKGSGTRLPMRENEPKVAPLVRSDQNAGAGTKALKVVNGKESRGVTTKKAVASPAVQHAAKNSATSPIAFPSSPTGPAAQEALERMMHERQTQQNEIDAMAVDMDELREQVKRANHERDTLHVKLTRATVDQSRTMNVHEDQMQDLKAGTYFDATSTLLGSILSLYSH